MVHIYIIAWVLLTHCLHALGPPGVLPFYNGGHFGTYDPALDWDKPSSKDKFQQDKILVSEFFADVMMVVRCVEYPVED
jgi:hypothetical protein